MKNEEQLQETETPDTPKTDETKQSVEENKIDWEAEAKKYKAIADRKSKKLEEIESSFKEEEPKKPNETSNNSTLSREETILYAKGYEEEEVELALKLSSLNGVSPLEATEDEIFKAKVEKRKQAEASANAALNASTGSYSKQPATPVEKMSREEHAEYVRSVMEE